MSRFIFDIQQTKDTETVNDVITKISVKEPSLHKVLMHNDDVTPMNFVVNILEKYFQKNTKEAVEIMLKVHIEGRGVCGLYVKEIAETKADLVMQESKINNYPLKCSIEEA